MPVDIYSVSEDKLSSEIEMSIDSMIQNGFKKIAIIAKNRHEARKIYCHLSGNKYQLIEREDANITSDIIIIPSYLLKGLEFDGVIVCNLTNDVNVNIKMYKNGKITMYKNGNINQA